MAPIELTAAPKVITTVRWRGDNKDEVLAFCVDSQGEGYASFANHLDKGEVLSIHAIDGSTIEVPVGHYVVKPGDGEDFLVYAPEFLESAFNYSEPEEDAVLGVITDDDEDDDDDSVDDNDENVTDEKEEEEVTPLDDDGLAELLATDSDVEIADETDVEPPSEG